MDEGDCVNRTLAIFKCNAGELHTHFRTRNDSIPNVMFYATILVNIKYHNV